MAQPRSSSNKSEGSLYDKVIQENLPSLIQAIVEKHLRLDTIAIEPIKLTFQRTIERKPDYLGKITDAEGNPLLLHLEFQTANKAEMIFRMNEYQGLILRKMQLPMLQYIIYMGHEPFRMATEFVHPDYTYRCRAWDVSKVPYQTFVASDIPEEIMLAICADYGEQPSNVVIRTILQRLKKVSSQERLLLRYVNQLTILSNMRKLEQETITESKAMDITGNIEEFELYQMGRKEGEKKGEKKGKKEGEKEAISALLKSQLLTPEQIAQTLNVPLKYVQELQAKL